MWVSVLFLPSPLRRVVVRAARAVLRAGPGSPTEIAAGDIAGFAKALADRKRDNVLHFTEAPDASVTRLLVESGVPILCVLDDPQVCIDHIALSRKIDGAGALRAASQHFAAIHDLAISGAAVHFDMAGGGGMLGERRVSDLLAFLAGVLNIDLSADELAALVPHVAAAGSRATGASSLDELALELQPELREAALPHSMAQPVDALFADVLSPYRVLGQRAGVSRMHWPPALFTRPGVDMLPPEGIDLTGPARIVAASPVLHLPPGRWLARPEFAVSDNASGNTLAMAVLVKNRLVAEARCALPSSGAFRCELAFDVIEARDAVAVRLSITQGAIEGRFALRGVDLERA